MKLPFVNKLSALTGVFARLNPAGLIAKIKARKKGGSPEDDEDDALPTGDDLFADLGDLKQLDAEAKANREGSSDHDFADFDNKELSEFKEDALEDETSGYGSGDDDNEDAVQTFDADDELENASASSASTDDIDLADLKVGGGFDDDDDDEEDEAAQKAKLKKLLLMAGGGVALAMVLGAGSWLLLGSDAVDAPGEHVAASANPQADAAAGEMVINLDEVPAYVDHTVKPLPQAPSGSAATASSAVPDHAAPAPGHETVAETPVAHDAVPVSHGGLPEGQSELAQLGLDIQVEPGVGIVIPSATKTSFAALKPWPASEPLVDAPVTALVEQGEHGLLPKISPEGQTPFEAYARPAPTQKSGDPKIALIVTGLGMSRAATEAAIAGMPADVAMSMNVYARGLDFWMRTARGAGHEVLLEMPGESIDFPFSDPGPNALKALVPPDENIKQLEWMLSQTTGYFGVLSVFGSKFLTVEEQVKAIAEALKKRGLMYVDGGEEDSLGSRVAYQVGAKWASVDMTLDTVPGRAAFDLQLQEFEDLAKKRAIAVARVSANPMVLEKLSAWLKTLGKKGLVLVPVSSLANKQLIR
ncbi:divergent polysaccharide deacetylase family protein [Magnetovibrio blakemorei]|uniref:Divergent polysaccharide deacetylase n=1 Tax=Magnetovibrio blakemorei TaxID=28181 RepID=A0A1E5Q7D4_9PROT|nr:divergent polysaccharide deacetylase family protein [Magnetovibrio blakemorei]OEJ67077.1 hypothetical protein BEN30_09875 [Magnetovibrio blakemorei]